MNFDITGVLWKHDEKQKYQKQLSQG